MGAQADARAHARELRAEGLPYKRIAAALTVSVNSAYRWTHDIELTPEQIERNRSGPSGPLNPEHVAARAAAASGRARERRAAWQKAGCMLYWAEGSKERNTIRFADGDPAMLAFFVAFLRGCFAVADDRIALRRTTLARRCAEGGAGRGATSTAAEERTGPGCAQSARGLRVGVCRVARSAPRTTGKRSESSSPRSIAGKQP